MRRTTARARESISDAAGGSGFARRRHLRSSRRRRASVNPVPERSEPHHGAEGDEERDRETATAPSHRDLGSSPGPGRVVGDGAPPAEAAASYGPSGIMLPDLPPQPGGAQRTTRGSSPERGESTHVRSVPRQRCPGTDRRSLGAVARERRGSSGSTRWRREPPGQAPAQRRMGEWHDRSEQVPLDRRADRRAARRAREHPGPAARRPRAARPVDGARPGDRGGGRTRARRGAACARAARVHPTCNGSTS
jgi:hypothetical protein